MLIISQPDQTEQQGNGNKAWAKAWVRKGECGRNSKIVNPHSAMSVIVVTLLSILTLRTTD